ncbi:MAG: hypothetical protein COB20_08380 [SAR86 cluster bacterium]|uniref:DUF2855 domain-containing protein n=1 Tax=SAR86 cluster bacterium TaxID=2030880 RepID=A0A2A4X4B9_9GAMM|nr:MAG: hypothetical protein COB20_08380 [SAR86 cluster bacterium]
MNELQILKSDITQARVVRSGLDIDAPLATGEILLKVDKFGFSANNVTYAAAGDQLGYWQFFPASDNESNTWGIIPVWGFADVVASSATGVDVGERVFGYYPTNSYLKMGNVKVLESRLIDGAEHRSKLPPGYNTYRRVGLEPGYDRNMDNMRMLLWPLYITSFCLWDSLQHNGWHGAKQVVVISASSKTSIGLGYALAADTDAPTSIGFTSKGNQQWVENLGLYDQTINYDALEDIDASIPTVIVDMSGNSTLLANLHAHLGENLAHCLNVGLTHWSEGGRDTGIPKEKREFFFAPSHIQMRMKEWGPEEFDSKSSQFITDSSTQSADWMKIEKLDGVEKLADIYGDVCAGKLPPEKALVIEL